MVDVGRLRHAFPPEMAEREEGPASCTPCATKIGEDPWTMISNGKAALAVPGASGPEVPKLGKVFTVREDAVSHRVHLRSLHVWLMGYRIDKSQPIRDGMLFGIRVDRGLIGSCLRGVDDEYITVYTHGVREPIVFVGEGWQAVVMPVEPIPTFDHEVSP